MQLGFGIIIFILVDIQKYFIKINNDLKENNESLDKYNIIRNFPKIIQEMIPTIKFDFFSKLSSNYKA